MKWSRELFRDYSIATLGPVLSGDRGLRHGERSTPSIKNFARRRRIVQIDKQLVCVRRVGRRRNDGIARHRNRQRKIIRRVTNIHPIAH